MKRVTVLGLVVAFTTVLVVGAALAKGKASFDQMCSSCHGASGKGDAPAAASLSPNPRDLTDKSYVNGLRDDYTKMTT